MNDVLRMINDQNTSPNDLKLSPAYLAEIIRMVDQGLINTTTGKTLLEKVESTGKSPRELVESEGLAKVSDDSAIRLICEEVIAESPAEVGSYKGGKVSLIGWFVGQVMKKMKGKADPTLARKILEELLA